MESFVTPSRYVPASESQRRQRASIHAEIRGEFVRRLPGSRHPQAGQLRQESLGSPDDVQLLQQLLLPDALKGQREREDISDRPKGQLTFEQFQRLIRRPALGI